MRTDSTCSRWAPVALTALAAAEEADRCVLPAPERWVSDEPERVDEPGLPLLDPLRVDDSDRDNDALEESNMRPVTSTC